METISLAGIRRNGGTQVRAQTDWLIVDDYAQSMKDGATFPPIVVYFDGSEYWLSDGFHRVEAAERAGLTDIAADVRRGTQRDAILNACSANAAHGLRRTNADKRRAVETLLRDEEWAQWSDGEISRRCAVSDRFVSSVRKDLTPNGSESDVRKGADGRIYNTANIGKPAALAPRPPTIPIPLKQPDYTPRVVEQRPQQEPALQWVGGEPKPYRSGDILPAGHPTHFVPARLAPDEVSIVADEDDEDQPLRLDTVEDEEKAEVVASDKPKSTMAVHFSSETPEHYTPQEIIELVVSVLGGIDLDPCSNSHDNPNVPAATHYTKEDDGLAQEWHGMTYMNPPYGREIGAWVDKLVKSYCAGTVYEAIALVPARVDTKWWKTLIEQCTFFCFVEGRLSFSGNDGNNAPFPSAVVYFGPNAGAFYHTFSSIGMVCKIVESSMDFGD